MALTLCIILYGFRTDGLRLHKRMVYFVPEGGNVDAAPFLRMIRNDTGYMQYAASHLLALFSREWVVQLIIIVMRLG